MHYTHHISLCIQIKCKKDVKVTENHTTLYIFLFITCKRIFLLFHWGNQWTQQHPSLIQFNKTNLLPSLARAMWIFASTHCCSFFLLWLSNFLMDYLQHLFALFCLVWFFLIHNSPLFDFKRITFNEAMNPSSILNSSFSTVVIQWKGHEPSH